MTRAGGPLPVMDAPPVRESDCAPSPIHAQAIDPTALAEAIVAGVLSLVCVNPAARRRLGLAAASRRADGRPAWYLWLAGSPGAYELALLPPALDADAPALGGAEFALRYFPHPEEDGFSAFAPVERQARASALFDHTGTPAIETMDALDPSLFHVATLSLAPSPDADGLALALEAQDMWLETTDMAGGRQARRAVPGLALAAPIADFLVCAHAYCGRRTPGGFTLTREPGMTWHVGAGGDARASLSRDASLFTLRVDGLPALGIPASLCAPTGGAETVMRAKQTLVHRHEGTAAPLRVAPFATDDWWKAASWRFYPVGAMCGCQVEDATVVGDDDSTPHRRRSVRR